MHEWKHMPDLIVPPGMASVDGHQVWSFVATGFVFSHFVSDLPPPDVVHQACLKLDGTMWVRVAEVAEISFLHRHLVGTKAAAV